MKLKTYQKFWDFESVIYHIEGFALPIPASITLASYFVASELLMIVLSNIPIINLLKFIPLLGSFYVWNVGIPILLSMYLNSVKLEGKKAHKYFFDVIVNLFEPTHYEYMTPIKKEKKERIKVKATVRRPKKMSVFEANALDTKDYLYKFDH